ncbi:MAG: ATP-binding protein [Rhodospirillaceae bacterium]
MLCIESIRRAGHGLHDILLTPLSIEDVQQLVSDTLSCPPSRAEPLARVVYDKSAGNPFFSNQFLSTLHEERLLELNLATGQWHWNITRIRDMSFTDNVVELMAGKLLRLPKTTRQALIELACLGNTVDTATLALVRGRSPDEPEQDLEEALQAGFIQRSRNHLRFVHDRVHEAAYALIPSENRAAIHVRIGHQLVSHLSQEALDESIFDVVNHFNLGLHLITDLCERAVLRKLNASAGYKAMSSSAYASARTYFTEATKLLPENARALLYEESFSLYFEQASCEYLLGNLQEADDLFSFLLNHARSNRDRAKVYRLRVQLYQVAGKFHQGVAAALEGVRLFGVIWPESDAEIEQQIEAERLQVAHNLRGRSISELIDAPITNSSDVRSVLGILTDAMPAAYFARPTIYPLFVLSALNLTLRNGNIEESCAVYMGYAIILMAVYRDLDTAFAFAELALKLNDKFGNRSLRGSLLCRYAIFLNGHRRPISTTLPMLEDSFVACQEVGNRTYGCYVALEIVWLWLESGVPLPEIKEKAQKYISFARKVRNAGIFQTLHAIELLISRLMTTTQGGMTATPTDDEESCLIELTKSGYGGGITTFHVMGMISAFLEERYEDVLIHGAEVSARIRAMTGWVIEATYHFYQALALAALHPDAAPDRQHAIRQSIEEHLHYMANRAANCRETFDNRHALLSAELARIDERTVDAMRHYEEAIRFARERGFVQNEALANELAARFYLKNGLGTGGDAHLRNAAYCYRRWGAEAKARQLNRHLPAQRAEGPTTAGAFDGRVEDLDLITVIKVSQAVSGVIVLDNLIDTLLKIVLEHAGADRGLLILARGDSYRIEAEAVIRHKQIEISRRQASIVATELPVSAFHYVVRTRQLILLNDASTSNQLSADPYLQSTPVKSLLCLPIIKQPNLIGVLYLENKLAVGAFTRNRIAVLDLLTSQAAISLENALLYTEMEDRVRERTRALSEEVTERTLAQARLNQIHNEQNLILNNASVGICTIIPENGRRLIKRANRAFEQIFGYQPNELIDMDSSSVYVYDDDYRKVGASYDAVLSLGQAYRTEMVLRRKDNHRIIIECVGAAINPSDLSKGTVWLLEDVTEQRANMIALEKAKTAAETALNSLRKAQESLVAAEKLASLGGLVAGVAHEINTPVGNALTAASSFSVKTERLTKVFAEGKMKKSDLQDYTEFSTEAARAIETNLRRAGELIQSFKQVAVDRTSEEKRSFRIKEYIEEVLLSLRPRLKKSSTSIELVCDDLLFVDTYPGAISQVINNFVTNSLTHAFEAGQPGTISIVITVAAEDMIELHFADNGCGIPQDILGRIFDPFFTTRRGSGGSGLGLHIVHNIVSGPLRGRISVQSSVGQGTRFTVITPRIIPCQNNPETRS